MSKASTITEDQLIESGWIKTDDPICPIKKILGKSEEGSLSLVVHRMYNSDQISLFLPDGGFLNINVLSIEELNQFERMIASYDPPY